MGQYKVTHHDLMYRFMLVNRYNKYSIYYDNKKRVYFRNNHINNMWNMIIN